MTNSSSKIEIKESLSNSLTIIAALVFLVCYEWYNKDKHIDKLGEPTFYIVIVLIVGFLLFKVYTLIKRKTIMAIDDQGVYHKDYGHMKWDEILSVKRTRKQGDGEIFFLLQTTRMSTPHEISLSNMDISEEELIKVIKSYKDYNIYEVPYNEW